MFESCAKPCILIGKAQVCFPKRKIFFNAVRKVIYVGNEGVGRVKKLCTLKMIAGHNEPGTHYFECQENEEGAILEKEIK